MQVTGRDTTLMRWLQAPRRRAAPSALGAPKREPLPAAAVIGADPGTILAAVTPVPDTLSEYQFAGLLRGRRVELVDCKTVPLKVPAEAEIVLEGPCLARRVRRRRALRRPHRLLQRGRALPGVPAVGDHDAARPDLSLDLHRPAAGRALGARRSAERGVHPAAAAAIPGDRRFLAAARGLLLPHRRRVDPQEPIPATPSA